MPTKQHSVFVVFGRNRQAYDAMTRFLRNAGLKVIDIPTARSSPGAALAQVNEVVEKAHRDADAIVVLMTPDEITFLRREFWAEGDTLTDKGPVKQSRPNVLDELGRSIRNRFGKTVLVTMGGARVPSNLGGVFVERFDGSQVKRRDLLTALENAGCDVNWNGPWMEEDPFFDKFEQAERECDPVIERGVPAGVEVENTYYQFEKLIDNQCRLVVRTGHNFGDPLRDHKQTFANTVIENLKRNSQLKIRLVFVPPEVMKTLHNKGIVDMIKVSIPLLWRLKYDSGLDLSQQSRLNIMCHVGALSLSAYIPNFAQNTSVMIV